MPLSHSRPPIGPGPPEGYDLILHCGVGYDGGIKLETRGDKTGYRFPDAIGELAPSIIGAVRDLPHVESEAERNERIRAVDGDVEDSEVIRGFGIER